MKSPDPNLLLNKYINELNSDNKRQRKQALESIRKEILNCDKVVENVVSSYEQIQKQIVKCFKDDSEAVRELSVKLVTDILEQVPSKEMYICTLMPTINDRLSGDVILESSEEVRLCLVLLIKLLISKYKDCLNCFLNDFINIFVKTIVDPYPKVKKESCDTVAELAKSIPQYFHMQSESIIKPLIQTSKHQQYRIRVAAINSIGTVVQFGNNKSVNDVCGPLAERLFDQHHAVRVAVADVVGKWLLDLRDRYSYFYKLIPLMLTCLSEEIPEHRQRAEELWIRIGQQYSLENETDLKEKMDYLQENLEHYPTNVRRPNLGCRTLVQRELSKYLPAITLELTDWKADVRVKSAQLLCVTVQHAESAITQNLEKTLHALYLASADTDSRVVDNIELAAEMIGYFVPSEVVCRLMLPGVEESSVSGPLRILAAILRSSQRQELKPHLSELAELLAKDGICYSRQGEYQTQLLKAVTSLLRVMKEDVVPVSDQLFNTIVSVLGLAADSTVSKQALALLEELSQVNGSSVQDLFVNLTPQLLDRVSLNVHDWSLHTPQRFVFEALLTHSGCAVGQNIDKLLSVLEVCLRPEVEPEAVLQTLMTVSYILTNSEQTLAQVPDLAQVINTLCIKVLSPQLVWRAGRSAEALRTAATGCLLAALQLVPLPSPTVRSLAQQLVPLLLTLIEDSAFKTRHFASLCLLSLIKSLRSQTELNAEDINRIFVVVMKRLDDNSDKVRETAVQTLCELFRTPLPADFHVDSYRSSLELLYDTMLLHLDDPVPAFQDLMIEALKEISTSHPQLLRSRIQIDNFRSKDKCEQLVKFLEDLKL